MIDNLNTDRGCYKRRKMPKPRQICVRFEEDEFRALDVKRFGEQGNWQSIGEQLWMGWLRGEQSAPPTPEPEPAVPPEMASLVASFLEFMRDDPNDHPRIRAEREFFLKLLTAEGSPAAMEKQRSGKKRSA